MARTKRKSVRRKSTKARRSPARRTKRTAAKRKPARKGSKAKRSAAAKKAAATRRRNAAKRSAAAKKAARTRKRNASRRSSAAKRGASKRRTTRRKTYKRKPSRTTKRRSSKAKRSAAARKGWRTRRRGGSSKRRTARRKPARRTRRKSRRSSRRRSARRMPKMKGFGKGLVKKFTAAMTNFGPMLSLGALAAVSFGVYSIGRGVLMSPRLSSVTGFVNNLPMDAQTLLSAGLTAGFAAVTFEMMRRYKLISQKTATAANFAVAGAAGYTVLTSLQLMGIGNSFQKISNGKFANMLPTAGLGRLGLGGMHQNNMSGYHNNMGGHHQNMGMMALQQGQANNQLTQQVGNSGVFGTRRRLAGTRVNLF